MNNGRAAIYARVSSTAQLSNTSIEGQLNACREHAVRLGYEVVFEAQDDISGTTFDRPGMDKVRELAAAGALDAVIVHKVDRLARDKLVSAVYEAYFQQCGLRLLFSDHDTSTEAGQTSAEADEFVSRIEKRTLARRFREGRSNKIKSGRILGGGHTAYGYRWIKTQGKGAYKKDGNLEINEDEAQWVRLIFQWLVRDQITMYRIAQRLQEAGAPTRRGAQWHISTLHSILRNPMYIGIWRWNKHEKVAPKPKGETTTIGGMAITLFAANRKKTAKRSRPEHEHLQIEVPHLALVDRETWEAAQRQLEANKHNNVRTNQVDYLLRGLLRCGVCGYRYHGHLRKRRGRGNDFISYECGQRMGRGYLGDAKCSNRGVKARPLEEAVWRHVVGCLRQPERLSLGQPAEEAQRLRAHDEQELATLRTQHSKLEEGDRRLLDAFEIGALDASELKQRRSATKDKLAALRSRITELEGHLYEVEAVQIGRREAKKLLRLVRAKVLLTADFSTRRAWLERLRIEATVYDDRVVVRGLFSEAVLPLASLHHRARRSAVYAVPLAYPAERHEYPARVRPETREELLRRLGLAAPGGSINTRGHLAHRERNRGRNFTAWYISPKPRTTGPASLFQFLRMWKRAWSLYLRTGS